MSSVSTANTLEYDAALCVNCGLCRAVCPHGVFARGDGVVQVVRPDACMECGACALNCPTGAIKVQSGVGCAYALMLSALTGKKARGCCGEDACCVDDTSPGNTDCRVENSSRSDSNCCAADTSCDDGNCCS